MPCKNDSTKATETDSPKEGVQPEENAPTCPCHQCPDKAKKVLLAGLVAGLAFAAFRAIRRSRASA